MLQMKLLKKSIFLKIIFALLLLSFLCYKLYGSRFINDLIEFKWNEVNGFYLLSCLLLMPVNWMCEAKKWQTLMATLSPLSFQDAFKAVLSGVSTGILTPNRVGNFIGRTLNVSQEVRTKSILLTFLSNISQFIATVVFGMVALLLFLGFQYSFNYGVLVVMSIAVLVIGFMVYFLPKIVDFKPVNLLYGSEIKEGIAFVQDTSVHVKLLALFWALLRYLVFMTQYVFVLKAFILEEDVSTVVLYVAVGLIYLIMTVLPSLSFGKLFIREAAALLVLTALSVPNAIILLSGFLIWAINIALPALVGGALILTRK
jgi:hypothetical protein